MGRTNATNFELGPALTAIAPREDDEEHKTAVIAGRELAKWGWLPRATRHEWREK